jgi:predicted transcriptional regulator of viral defense system
MIMKAKDLPKASIHSSESAKNLAELVDRFQESGRYTFVREEALRELNINAENLKRAAKRLTERGRIAVPRRGFYVIVPLEYRVAGAPPSSWFISQLMMHLGHPYYVGLLSAAALYGAAHQQPQEYQVITDRPQRSMHVGRNRIRFLVKKNIGQAAIEEHRTETGTVRVSTPEATAIDLLRYAMAAGGLDNVATVLSELAERIDKQKLVEAAKVDGEMAFAQRLGYILENVVTGNHSSNLAEWINEKNPRNIPLNPGKPIKGQPANCRWRIIINDRIEGDI